MTKLQRLALERAIELGQEAFTIHEGLVRWKPDGLSEVEKTKLCLSLKGALEKQRTLLDAVLEEGGEDHEP